MFLLIALLTFHSRNRLKKALKNTFDINFVLDKYYNIKELIFSEADSKIFLSNIKLNKNFEVKDFKKLKFKTFRKKNKNNDFVIEKSDKITISGKVFDAQYLLKSL